MKPDHHRQMNQPRDVLARIHKTDSCWIWLGVVLQSGYGQINYQGRRWAAHRIVYTLLVGEIPRNLYVLHKCDTPLCVNPGHLFLGTAAENSADMVAKGRCKAPRGEAQHLAKLTEADIRKIREDKRPYRVVAKDFNISSSQISDIRNRKAWAHVL